MYILFEYRKGSPIGRHQISLSVCAFLSRSLALYQNETKFLCMQSKLNISACALDISNDCSAMRMFTFVWKNTQTYREIELMNFKLTMRYSATASYR